LCGFRPDRVYLLRAPRSFGIAVGRGIDLDIGRKIITLFGIRARALNPLRGR
jgi:hypothetical protein